MCVTIKRIDSCDETTSSSSLSLEWNFITKWMTASLIEIAISSWLLQSWKLLSTGAVGTSATLWDKELSRTVLVSSCSYNLWHKWKKYRNKSSKSLKSKIIGPINGIVGRPGVKKWKALSNFSQLALTLSFQPSIALSRGAELRQIRQIILLCHGIRCYSAEI